MCIGDGHGSDKGRGGLWEEIRGGLMTGEREEVFIDNRTEECGI